MSQTKEQRWMSRRSKNVDGMLERAKKSDKDLFEMAYHELMNYADVPHKLGDESAARLICGVANLIFNKAQHIKYKSKPKYSRRKKPPKSKAKKR